MTLQLTTIFHSCLRRRTSLMFRWMACVMALVAASCGHDMPDTVDTGNDSDYFLTGFIISVGRAPDGRLSRSIPSDGPYEAGEGLENAIGEGDYGFYLFDSSNRLISLLDVESLNLVASDGVNDTYNVVTRVPRTDVTEDVFASGGRIVALANWGEYPRLSGALYPEMLSGAATLDDLCDSAAAFLGYTQQRSVLSEDNLMPFYGVKEFSRLTFVKNRAEVGTVYLLRAMAKIQVVLEAAVGYEDCELTDVTLTRAASLLRKAPKGVYAEKDYITGSWYSDYTPAEVPAPADSHIPVALTRSAGGIWTAYVPEFLNMDSDGNPLPEEERARLRLTFTSEHGVQSGCIDFRYYSGSEPDGIAAGTPFNICRNNCYRFNVVRTLMPELEVSVDVLPYRAIDLEPEFGLRYDPVSGYREVWQGGRIYYWLDAAGTPWYQRSDAGRNFTLVFGGDIYGNVNPRPDHWFDADGNKRSLVAADLAGMTAVGDEWGNVYYWYDRDLRQKWLVQNENYSVYVYQYYPGTGETVGSFNPWGDPECWYDYMGGRHEPSEPEAPVVAEWRAFLNSIGL